MEALLRERANELVRPRNLKFGHALASERHRAGDVDRKPASAGDRCVACGHEIPAARLKLVPDAVRCVSCQIRFESTSGEIT